MLGLVILLVVAIQFRPVADTAPKEVAPGVDMSTVLPDDRDEPPLAADEPAGPAGEGAPGEAKPPPVASRRPPPKKSSRRTPPKKDPEPQTVVVPQPEPEVDLLADDTDQVVVVTVPAQQHEPAPEPAPAPAASGVGKLTIGSLPGGEVYVDGSYVRKTPLAKKEFPAGSHTVTIVAEDGRKKTFEVELNDGELQKWIWDFDRGDWR